MSGSGERVFGLQPIVVIRLAVEYAVLAILVALPVVLALAGELGRMEAYLRGAIIVSSPLALLVLSGSLQIPWKVVLDDEGLTMRAPVKATRIKYSQLETVRLIASWGWRRYLLVYRAADDEPHSRALSATFPVWFAHTGALVEAIRSRLPNRGHRASEAAVATFGQHPATTVLEYFKTGATVGFVGVFWLFYRSLSLAGGRSEDLAVITIAGILFSSLALVRLFFTVTMPVKVTVGPESIELSSPAWQACYQWSEVTAVKSPFFMLPEGLMLRCRGKWRLLGASLEGFDELEERLKAEVPPLERKSARVGRAGREKAEKPPPGGGG